MFLHSLQISNVKNSHQSHMETVGAPAIASIVACGPSMPFSINGTVLWVMGIVACTGSHLKQGGGQENSTCNHGEVRDKIASFWVPPSIHTITPIGPSAPVPIDSMSCSMGHGQAELHLKQVGGEEDSTINHGKLKDKITSSWVPPISLELEILLVLKTKNTSFGLAQSHQWGITTSYCITMREERQQGKRRLKMKSMISEKLWMFRFSVLWLRMLDKGWYLVSLDGCSRVSSGDTGTDVLFGLVLRLSPTKLWPVASGPWHLL